jgi:hypothetical protein
MAIAENEESNADPSYQMSDLVKSLMKGASTVGRIFNAAVPIE